MVSMGRGYNKEGEEKRARAYSQANNRQLVGSHVRLPQPTHNVLLRRDWIILLGIPGSRAMRQTRDFCVEIWVTEESYRLTPRSDGFRLVDRFSRRGDDSMKGGT